MRFSIIHHHHFAHSGLLGRFRRIGIPQMIGSTSKGVLILGISPSEENVEIPRVERNHSQSAGWFRWLNSRVITTPALPSPTNTSQASTEDCHGDEKRDHNNSDYARALLIAQHQVKCHRMSIICNTNMDSIQTTSFLVF